MTLILHTGTTQLAGGWSAGRAARRHTSLSTSHRHQLQELTHARWLLHLRIEFNIIISSSRILSISDRCANIQR